MEGIDGPFQQIKISRITVGKLLYLYILECLWDLKSVSNF